MKPSEYAKRKCKTQKELIYVLSQVVDHVGLKPEIDWVIECIKKDKKMPIKIKE
jgi:hypothetical protein